MRWIDYITAMSTLRNLLDIALVFVIVYVVLKLLRGTRAVPTMVGIVLIALLYWLAVAQDLAVGAGGDQGRGEDLVLLGEAERTDGAAGQGALGGDDLGLVAVEHGSSSGSRQARPTA